MRRLAAALPSRRRSVQAQALLAICSGSHASLCVRRCSRERGRGAPSPERGRRCGCRCRDNKLVRPSASPGALCVCTLWWHGGRLLCCAARRSPTAPTLCAAVSVGGGCEDVRFDRAPVWVYSGRQRADRNVREVLLGWRRPPARRVRTSHYRTRSGLWLSLCISSLSLSLPTLERVGRRCVCAALARTFTTRVSLLSLHCSAASLLYSCIREGRLGCV